MNIFETDTGLKKETIQQIQKCFSHHVEVKKVILYGSRAKGNYKKGSDIDLSIVGKNADTKTILKIEHELDDLMLPYSFDVSVYHLIDNSNFKEHIDRVGLTFFEK